MSLRGSKATEAISFINEIATLPMVARNDKEEFVNQRNKKTPYFLFWSFEFRIFYTKTKKYAQW
ncbi:MAG: hypothetical protein A2042_07505 [Candidatus Schekmanbacteria bacterium GWA2_38_11]|uniref:Uncharacterized protein n=1 Tax=Candidatus Schekmanbacteria bacterium GWA2_38_11 TaxID=1817876 RepID=A0A1F7RH21_9BACT|nr:MAG: hypothetical protein A2042_07505 [Candidatus Schekmanbacteria bacterium GWA2_38_11]